MAAIRPDFSYEWPSPASDPDGQEWLAFEPEGDWHWAVLGPGFDRSGPEIDTLADQLEHDTGCTINREELVTDMMYFSTIYRDFRLDIKSHSAQAVAAIQRAYRQCRNYKAAL